MVKIKLFQPAPSFLFLLLHQTINSACLREKKNSFSLRNQNNALGLFHKDLRNQNKNTLYSFHSKWGVVFLFFFFSHNLQVLFNRRTIFQVTLFFASIFYPIVVKSRPLKWNLYWGELWVLRAGVLRSEEMTFSDWMYHTRALLKKQVNYASSSLMVNFFKGVKKNHQPRIRKQFIPIQKNSSVRSPL